MTEVLTTTLPTNSSNTYPYIATHRKSISIESTPDSTRYENTQKVIQNVLAASTSSLSNQQSSPNLALIPVSTSSSSSSIATVVYTEASQAELLRMAAVPSPLEMAHDRQQAAGSPMQPVASTSALPASAQSNGKAKQTEYTTQFVNLPNVAPRSYTILKEVGDGSFGTVWLADWHSPLEYVFALYQREL